MSTHYPILLRRYLASLLDLLIPLGFAALIGKTLSIDTEPTISATWLVLLVPFLIYEPLLTAFYATIGQLIFKFRVRKLNEIHRISIGQAFLRLIAKYALGGVSFLTLPARADRKAIHDLVSGSIVVNSSTTAAQN